MNTHCTILDIILKWSGLQMLPRNKLNLPVEIRVLPVPSPTRVWRCIDRRQGDGHGHHPGPGPSFALKVTGRLVRQFPHKHGDRVSSFAA
jgi:hypothetical protein